MFLSSATSHGFELVGLFVCFKGRIEHLPDESDPYLQSSPGTNETQRHLFSDAIFWTGAVLVFAG